MVFGVFRSICTFYSELLLLLLLLHRVIEEISCPFGLAHVSHHGSSEAPVEAGGVILLPVHLRDVAIRFVILRIVGGWVVSEINRFCFCYLIGIEFIIFLSLSFLEGFSIKSIRLIDCVS